MLQNLLVQMESCSSVSMIAKRITILDSIQFLKIACQQISANTITKCFLNVGFVFAGEEQLNSESADEEMATGGGIVEIQNLIQSTFGSAICSASDFVTIDDCTTTEHNSIDLDEIIADNIASEPEEVTVSDDADDDDDIAEVGNRDVIQAFRTLEIYGRQSGENGFYDTVSKLKASYVQGKVIARKQKQTSILQYFN